MGADMVKVQQVRKWLHSDTLWHAGDNLTSLVF